MSWLEYDLAPLLTKTMVRRRTERFDELDVIISEIRLPFILRRLLGPQGHQLRTDLSTIQESSQRLEHGLGCLFPGDR